MIYTNGKHSPDNSGVFFMCFDRYLTAIELHLMKTTLPLIFLFFIACNKNPTVSPPANQQSSDFSFKSSGILESGNITSAKFQSNTLIIDAAPSGGQVKYQLMIRTGSSIKTGTFINSKAESVFYSAVGNERNLWISGMDGNLTVTIQSVNGNIVEGIFSGTASIIGGGATTAITEGKFKCSVLNYTPLTDSAYKWSFGEFYYFQNPLNLIGGNVTSATKYQANNWNYLEVKGESDGGLSKFLIRLKSQYPILSGLYSTTNNIRIVDSFSFHSPWWYYSLGAAPNFYFEITSIDNAEVEAKFFGNILKEISPGVGWTGTVVNNGSLRARF